MIIDESGANLNLTRRYARAPRDQRAYGGVPRNTIQYDVDCLVESLRDGASLDLAWRGRYSRLASRPSMLTRQAAPADAPPTSLPNDSAQQPSADPLWSRVLDQLRPQFPASEFATWLAPTALVQLDGGTAVIAVEHIFARDTLETRYQAALTTALQVVGQHWRSRS